MEMQTNHMADMGQRIVRAALEEIEAEGSRYRLSLVLQRLEESGGQDACGERAMLYQSLEASGILVPLMARHFEGRLHLVDGFKRHAWARKMGLSHMELMVLPEEADDLEIMLFLAQEHGALLSSVPAARALYLSFCKGLGLSERALVRRIMPAVGLPPADRLFKKYLAVAGLPEEALAFAASKNLSFKRCLSLSSYPRPLLSWLMKRRGQLHLTASICEEILDSLNELMKRKDCTLQELLTEGGLEAILEDPDQSVSRRTALFRKRLSGLRRPVSTAVNQELEALKRRAEGGHAPFEVAWDRSLEHESIELRIAVTAPEQLDAALVRLSSGESRQALLKMLDRLKG